jgi:hypothetical protein
VSSEGVVITAPSDDNDDIHVRSDDKYVGIFVKYEVWSTGGMVTSDEYDDRYGVLTK